LSLYLLLKNRRYLSAFSAGAGFMIKLFPVILLPIAAQLVSKKKLEIRNYKLKILKPEAEVSPPTFSNSNFSFQISHASLPFDLPRILLYLAIFTATVILIGLPFYLMNPALILGSQQINDARQPWQTIWALFDGNYNYGSLPLDLRDLAWNPANKEATSIPWLPITAGFGLVYAFFYTRPLNWRQPRIALAFVGFTVCLFMTWSKGYSPQWLGWVLFFIALLLPNLRGVIYAVILSAANIIEANFYFIIFPTEHWLFAATILIRTFLFILVGIEFLWLIWPPSARIIKIRTWAVAGALALLLAGLITAGLRLSQAYVDLRQQQSPYTAAITRLQGEKVKGALLLNSQITYDWFYPYLRRDYTLYMLDDYAPPGASVAERTTTLLNRIAGQTKVLWIYDADASVTTPAEKTLSAWLGDTPLAHIQDIDGGRLYLFILR
jgi:hypothetical protein